jgi:hypothetical protein
MTAESNDALDPRAALRQLIIARNAPGVRQLAHEQGLSREELAALLREELERQQHRGGEDRLGPRYDVMTGEYTTLEEWVEQVIGGR